MARRVVWQSGVAVNLAREMGVVDAREAVERLAEAIRSGWDSTRALDVEAFAKTRGLIVEYRVLHVDALLNVSAGGYVAVVNSSASPARRRFSIAHEIGHLEIARTTKLAVAMEHGLLESEAERTSVERLCDTFAAALLMPRDAWRSRLLEGGLSWGHLNYLARLYGVSFWAAAARVFEIDIWHGAVVVWEWRAGDADEGELWPCRAVSNIGLRLGDLRPAALPGRPSDRGAPQVAWESKGRSVGKMNLKIDHEEQRYFGESRMMFNDPKKVVTVIVAEPDAQRVLGLFRARSGGDQQLEIGLE